MANTDFTEEDRAMLGLAALAYRGFSASDVLQPNEGRIRAALVPWLEKQATVLGHWDLVWGPVSYSAPFSLFDDSLMYVVRAHDADRYVIAIRGTNPISAFDWLFGDLWVRRQTPWPYGDPSRFPGAKISLSTSLGLNVLQSMRSSGPRGGPLAQLWRTLEEDVGGVLQRAAASLLQPIGGTLGSTLRSIRIELGSLLGELAQHRRARQGQDFEEQIEAIRADRASPAWRTILQRVDEAVDRFDEATDAQREHISFNVLRLLVGGSRLRSQLASGQDLGSFLKAVVAQAPGAVEVVVTGHSKGGALSSTLALWLADTQGKEAVPQADRWDPDRKATVRCFSYAGPSAGNATFATRSDTFIGPNCHRIANTLDIVPHAWEAEDLHEIPDLYGAPVHRIPGLGILVREIIEDVGSLAYSHVRLNVKKVEGALDPTKKLFVTQLVHQHLDAYLEALGLLEHMRAATIFNPLC